MTLIDSVIDCFIDTLSVEFDLLLHQRNFWRYAFVIPRLTWRCQQYFNWACECVRSWLLLFHILLMDKILWLW